MKLSTGIVEPMVASYASLLNFFFTHVFTTPQGELSRMLPEDIGHAAAYEAYRTWIHNSSIYEPLSGDTARQREGLIGLAVAEGNPCYF